MAKQKHTPEQEWFWYQNGLKCDIYDTELVKDGEEWRIPHGANRVATIHDTGDIEATKEKTRLIASCPELFSALKWFMAKLDDQTLVRNTDHDHNNDYNIRMIAFVRDLQRAQAAIKAAEGEE